MSLKIHQLSFQYKTNKPLIHNLNLLLQTGEVLAITGASGCGKSTLLQLILGFLKPESGSIQFSDRTLSDPKTFISPDQRRIGIVFQDYALFPHLTVRDNIGFGLKLNRKLKQPRIDEWLKLFGLSEVAFSYPHQLSGGQMQRVAIARAIAPEPALLLLDEPFSNLDTALSQRLRTELKPLLKSLQTTILLVTHHREDAVFLADKIVDFSELMR
jgi:iron(III) transport system ATP-binding protein